MKSSTAKWDPLMKPIWYLSKKHCSTVRAPIPTGTLRIRVLSKVAKTSRPIRLCQVDQLRGRHIVYAAGILYHHYSVIFIGSGMLAVVFAVLFVRWAAVRQRNRKSEKRSGNTRSLASRLTAYSSLSSSMIHERKWSFPHRQSMS